MEEKSNLMRFFGREEDTDHIGKVRVPLADLTFYPSSLLTCINNSGVVEEEKLTLTTSMSCCERRAASNVIVFPERKTIIQLLLTYLILTASLSGLILFFNDRSFMLFMSTAALNNVLSSKNIPPSKGFFRTKADIGYS